MVNLTYLAIYGASIFRHMANRFRIGYATFAFLDQSICAAINFATMAVGARLLTSDEFGLYILLFGIQVFILAIHNIYAGPMRIRGTDLKLGMHATYFSRRAILALCLSFFLSIIASIFLFASSAVGARTASLYAIMTVIMQMAEFSRSAHLATASMNRLFIQDLVSAVGRGLGLLVLMQLHRPNIDFLLIMISCASTLAFLVGADREWLRQSRPGGLSGVIRESWAEGRWWALEALLAAAAPQIYYISVLNVLGKGALAGLGAVQSMMNTSFIVLLPLANLATFYIRRQLVEGGKSSWRRSILLFSMVVVFVQGSFTITAILFGELGLRLIYGWSYGAHAGLIPYACVQYGATAASLILMVAYRTAERAYLTFRAQVVAFVVALAVSYPLAVEMGAVGALLGLALSSVACTGALLLSARGLSRVLSSKVKR